MTELAKAIQTTDPGTEESEAFRHLVGIVGRRSKVIPAELLAEHALTVTREMDWPVQRAALEEILKRISFATRDQLKIASRPGRNKYLGTYKTKAKNSKLRPYTTALFSLYPIVGRCNCPDFLKNSLGLCKHLLTIMLHIFEKDIFVQKALAEQEIIQKTNVQKLNWHPVRPALGEGDFLNQVQWIVGNNGGSEKNTSLLSRWFSKNTNGFCMLKNCFADDPRQRLVLVKLIQRYVDQDRQSADPALLNLLEQEKTTLENLLLHTIPAELVTKNLQSLKRKLYPYQLKGVKRFLESTKLLLADDMGLGKTIQAAAACHVLWKSNKVKRGLIIAPASLKSQWEREWILFTNTPVAQVEGGAGDRAKIYQKTNKGFLLANYEQVLRDLNLMYQWNPDIIVLDEAQRIKNWQTKTSSYVKQLSPQYRLVLTGTPMENRMEELASILEWVDDYALQPRWRLLPWHSISVDGKNEIGGVRNLDTLRTRLAPRMLRRRRQEVLKQLPKRTDTRVPVPMTEEQMDEHAELDIPIARLLSITKKRPLIQAEFLQLMSYLTKQRIISNGLAQYNYEAMWPSISNTVHPTDEFLSGLFSPKLIEFRELMKQIVVEQGRKVVVFSQWRRMLQLANWVTKDTLASIGARALMFTGQESQKRRTQNIVDFHDQPEAMVLFATDAGGVGLNLQRAASCCICLEVPWNPAVLEQRIARIYRIGQKRPIDVYMLSTNCGIEAKMFALVHNKKAFFSGLFDGTSDEVTFEQSGSFLKKLETIIEPVSVPILQKQEEDTEEPMCPGDRDASQVQNGETPSTPTTKEENTQAPSEVFDANGFHENGSDETSFALSSFSEAAQLFAKVSAQRATNGAVTLNIPADAASAISNLFQGFMSFLQRSAQKTP